MTKSKKICLVGGEDAHKRIPFTEYLLKNDWEVTLIGTKEIKYPNNIKFILYPLNRKLNLISDAKTLIAYRHIFKQNNFNIIQTYDTKPAFLVPLAAIGNKIKIVRTITGLGTIFMSNAAKYKILRTLYYVLHWLVRKKVTHTIFQNNEDWEYYLKNKLVNKKNSSLILGSGIELKKDRSLANRDNNIFTFIFVGRLVYEKGVINYLEAAKICIDKGQRFKFLLVGPLEEGSNRLNSKILEDYGNFVDWVGERADVNELMIKSNAFVLPTFREGLSRVILEACSVGLPIITTKVPGTQEIVRDMREGLLINVNDSEDLAKKMIMLGNDPDMANIFSEHAKKRVIHFSLANISAQYIKLYNSYL